MPDGYEKNTFFSRGLNFTCVRCSACCRHESGYVFLSRKDTSRLETTLNVDHEEFVKTFCRWVPSANGEKLSLKETANFDCIFWSLQEGGGCAIYNDRPLQCRAFPFWESILGSPGSWKSASRDCPGMNRGELHTGKSIRKWLDRREAEPHILRKPI